MILGLIIGVIVGVVFGGAIVAWIKREKTAIGADVQSAEEKLIP